MSPIFFERQTHPAVDDEKDIIETIQEILDTATVDSATDYETASEKSITPGMICHLDIMGVNVSSCWRNVSNGAFRPSCSLPMP